MKKTVALLLSLMLAAGVFASCGKKDKNDGTQPPVQNDTQQTEETAPETEESDKEAVDTSAFTPEGVITSIYTQKAPLFPVGFMPLDMTDKDSYGTYLGLEDVSVIKEAAVSESMMGSQAYSLVVARVNEGENAAEIAEKIKNGINPRKWICVGADDIKVTSAGDLICFCMISTEYAEDFTADDAMNAFTKIVNGEVAYTEYTEENLTEEPLPEEEVAETEEESEAAPKENPENNKADSPENKGEEKPLKETKPEAEEPAEDPVEEPAEENVPAANPEPEQVPEETTENTGNTEDNNVVVTEPEQEAAPEEAAPEEAAPEAAQSNFASNEDIINAMYAIKSPQFMLASIPVDLSDKDACSTYLGLSDSSKIEQAVVSEPMIGAQAYSLVVAKVAPGKDANAVAAEMKAGIDPRKWICVEADDIKVTVVGDYICFCMISTEFAEDFTADDAMNAFRTVVK